MVPSRLIQNLPFRAISDVSHVSPEGRLEQTEIGQQERSLLVPHSLQVRLLDRHLYLPGDRTSVSPVVGQSRGLASSAGTFAERVGVSQASPFPALHAPAARSCSSVRHALRCPQAQGRKRGAGRRRERAGRFALSLLRPLRRSCVLIPPLSLPSVCSPPPLPPSALSLLSALPLPPFLSLRALPSRSTLSLQPLYPPVGPIPSLCTFPRLGDG
jgi:hypothetical protein